MSIDSPFRTFFNNLLRLFLASVTLAIVIKPDWLDLIRLVEPLRPLRKWLPEV